LKVLLKFILLLCLSVEVRAEYYGDHVLLGLSMIRQTVDMQSNNNGVISEISESGNGFGLYFDKFYQYQYRFSGAISYVTFNSFAVTELMFSADYLIPVDETMSIFAGLALGGVAQDFNDAAQSDLGIGLGYGAQLGGMKFLSENVLLEAGYRLRISDIATDFGAISQSSIVLDKFNEFYISVLLMF